MNPRYEESIEFLRKIAPEGPWVLTAIIPDPPKKGRKTFTATFTANDERSLRVWLERQGASRNLYYTANPCRRPMSDKPTKADIAAMSWLYVDVDPNPPPVGVDKVAHNTAERERIRELLRHLPGDAPEPTYVVFSGGGYQAAWRLREPIPLAGTKEAAAEAERYNRRLEELLGADNCHNVDRLLRLPGTINRPDAKKRKKGRGEALAEVVVFDGGDHDIVLFERAEPKRATKKAAPRIIESLDELPEDVPRLCRVAIANGCDPEEPWRWRKGDGPAYSDGFGLMRGFGDVWEGDRSDVLHYVICELLRCRVDDDTIRALLLDDGWVISDSVLDGTNGDPEFYVDRQIQKAEDVVGYVRPAIYADPGRRIEIISEVSAALRRARVPIYQRNNELVHPVVLERDTSDDGLRRSRGATVIYEVKAPWLQNRMAEAAEWRRHTTAKKDKWSPTDPTQTHALALMGDIGNWSFPVLRGVVSAPTLREDGSVLQEPGYDSASGLIYDPGDVLFPPVPDNPTREDAIAALAKFEPLFAGFPFVDDAAKAVVWSAILSGLVSHRLSAIPLHAFDAPTAGTGKSLLAEVVGIIVLGHKPSAMTQGKEEAEDEKRISTALRAGDRLLWIDNCERAITGEMICSVLTQEFVNMRILGKSEQVKLFCNVLMMATGNNLVIGGDVTRRAMRCRLDAKMERPDTREFEFDARVRAAAERPELVVAGLTALRAYVGRPAPLPAVGSFEAWSELVRETLVWCGYGDPDRTRTRVLDDDPRKAELAEVLETWFKYCGDKPMRVSEAGQSEELCTLLTEATGKHMWSPKSVGWYLKRNVDRVVDGLVDFGEVVAGWAENLLISRVIRKRWFEKFSVGTTPNESSRARRYRMTKERKEIFLAELGRTGVFAHAARTASPDSLHGALTSFREERERDPEFAAAWDEAVDHSTGMIEREAIRRAVEGWHDGKVQKYSDRLMELILKRRDPEYREHRKYEVDAKTEVTGKKKLDLRSLSPHKLELLRQLVTPDEDSPCPGLGPEDTSDATPDTTDPWDDRAPGSITEDL